MNVFIAVDTINLIVRTISKVCWIHLVATLSTGETFPVIAARLGNLLLSLEHPALTPGTHIKVTIFTWQTCHISLV